MLEGKEKAGKKIKCLLEPIQAGPLLLKNRMVRSPMASRFASVTGEVTEAIDRHVCRFSQEWSVINNS
jgi:2,4-dienoyl-CoA reductase-like NADH-dependent reductase (Old Yellow Enzyme family)